MKNKNIKLNDNLIKYKTEVGLHKLDEVIVCTREHNTEIKTSINISIRFEGNTESIKEQLKDIALSTLLNFSIKLYTQYEDISETFSKDNMLYLIMNKSQNYGPLEPDIDKIHKQEIDKIAIILGLEYLCTGPIYELSKDNTKARYKYIVDDITEVIEIEAHS